MPSSARSRFPIALLVSFFAAAVVAASAEEPPLQTQLSTQVQARLDAIAIGDKAPWERDLDPAALLMDEEGNVTTKAQLLAELQQLPKGSWGTLRLTQPHFSQIGDLAILAFIADENETIYGQHFHADFGEVDTYHKTNAGWLLASETETRLPQEPPTVRPTAAQMQAVAGNYRMLDGPLVFAVTIVNGQLFGGRQGSTPLRMYAIADQPGQYFRPHRPETLIFVPNAGGRATKLIDRRYYNRDMVYERVDK
jgi:hypothetical protein